MIQLHPSTEALVRRVEDSGKPFDWYAEFGAIAELNRLAHEQDHPPARDLPALLDTPISVGNVTLSRLSWAGVEWYNTLAMSWYANDPHYRDIALAWAHAHSRDPEAFTAMSHTASRTRRKLRAWAWSVKAPWEAVQAAVDVLLPQPVAKTASIAGDDAPDAPDAAKSNDAILARLVSRTGLPEAHWLFEVSYDQVVAVLREIAASSFQEQAQMAALLGHRLHDPDESWAVQSFIRFRDAAKAFLARHGIEDKPKKRAAKTVQSLEKEPS